MNIDTEEVRRVKKLFGGKWEDYENDSFNNFLQWSVQIKNNPVLEIHLFCGSIEVSSVAKRDSEHLDTFVNRAKQLFKLYSENLLKLLDDDILDRERSK